MFFGALSVVAWFYSGWIGQFIGLRNFDPRRYPYDVLYPYVRAHWPLQLLLFLGGPLFLFGIGLFLVDLIRIRRKQ
jgi:hypothetical protein